MIPIIGGITVHESMVTSVQKASSREVTSRMRRSIRPKHAMSLASARHTVPACDSPQAARGSRPATRDVLVVRRAGPGPASILMVQPPVSTDHAQSIGERSTRSSRSRGAGADGKRPAGSPRPRATTGSRPIASRREDPNSRPPRAPPGRTAASGGERSRRFTGSARARPQEERLSLPRLGTHHPRKSDEGIRRHSPRDHSGEHGPVPRCDMREGAGIPSVPVDGPILITRPTFAPVVPTL
jgi:hypothetical protein